MRLSSGCYFASGIYKSKLTSQEDIFVYKVLFLLQQQELTPGRFPLFSLHQISEHHIYHSHRSSAFLRSFSSSAFTLRSHHSSDIYDSKNHSTPRNPFFSACPSRYRNAYAGIRTIRVPSGA